MISMKSNYVNHKTTYRLLHLRMMMAALKISTDFERMGDNADTHSSYSSSSKDYRSYVLTRLKTMGKLAMLMLQDLNLQRNKRI